jgi:uncharacterized cupin superfamily protein
MKPRLLPVLPALSVAPRAKSTSYPAPFAKIIEGREKRALGDAFGLTRFGINLTRLAPGATSALRHAHALQDEFIYVLQGTPLLRTDAGSFRLDPGMCSGFPAGTGNAHHLVNDTQQEVLYLEAGDRTPGDHVSYPDDDVHAVNVDGAWQFTHKDGTPY